MNAGWVYILTNEHMPGLVKVGKTTRDVESRAGELFQTGVPSPFHVYGRVYSPDCHSLEVAMHKSLAGSRVSDGREFFKCDPHDALEALDRLHEECVSEWLELFLPDHVFVHVDLFIDPGRFAELSDPLGVHPVEVKDALERVEAAELGPALSRVKQIRDLRKSRFDNGVMQ